MSFVRQSFVDRMELELIANMDKGDWRTWSPDDADMLGELNHHVVKLARALGRVEREKVGEFAADVANIAMRISEIHGDS